MREIFHVIRSTWIKNPRCRTRMTRESTRVATCLSQRNIRNTRLWIGFQQLQKMMHLLFTEGTSIILICTSRSISGLLLFQLVGLPRIFQHVSRIWWGLLQKPHHIRGLSSALCWLLKVLLAFASTRTRAEFSIDALAPFFMSITLWQFSSLQTSANTSLSEGREAKPMILPLHQILHLGQREICSFNCFPLSSYGDCNHLKIPIHSHWKYLDPTIAFSKYWSIWWWCLPHVKFLQAVVAVHTLGIDCWGQNISGEYYPKVPWQLDSTYS